MAQTQVYDILDNTEATMNSKRDICTTVFQCDNKGKSEDKIEGKTADLNVLITNHIWREHNEGESKDEIKGKTADSNVLITNHKWRERAGRNFFSHPPLQDSLQRQWGGFNLIQEMLSFKVSCHYDMITMMVIYLPVDRTIQAS